MQQEFYTLRLGQSLTFLQAYAAPYSTTNLGGAVRQVTQIRFSDLIRVSLRTCTKERAYSETGGHVLAQQSTVADLGICSSSAAIASKSNGNDMTSVR